MHIERGPAISRVFQNRKLLHDDALNAIEKAIADAESKTSCEFAVVIAPASARYFDRILMIAFAAMMVAFCAHYLINRFVTRLWTDPAMLLLESVCVAGVVLVCGVVFPAFQRLLIPKRMRSDRVDVCAHASFSEQNIHLTADRNGCLIYVSVLEGEVRLMADVGMRTKVGENKIGEVHASLLNPGSANAVTVLCDAILALGELCSEPFPIADDDENEIPDRPIIRLP